jgi:hypothetical protein
MRLLLVWLIIGSIGVASGMAILTNTIDIDAQEMGVFLIPCEDHSENCEIINPTSDSSFSESTESAANPWAAQREYSSMVVENEFETQQTADSEIVIVDTDTKKGNEGCTVGFWIDQSISQDIDSRLVWPSGYLSNDKFNSPSTFNSKLTILGNDDPSLIDALNAQGDGINKLARHAVAALLNSAAYPTVKYPLTTSEVVSFTNEAILNSDYAIADTFAEYNNLGNTKLCS